MEYCLDGNYIRWNFLDCKNPGRNFLGGNFPGGSYPGWKLSEWESSWVGIFRVGIARVGVILGGNLLWWGVFRVGIFWVGVFLVPNDASTKSDQNITKDLWIAFAWFLKNLKIYYNLPRI